MKTKTSNTRLTVYEDFVATVVFVFIVVVLVTFVAAPTDSVFVFLIN